MSEKFPLVSVLMTAYNREEYIAEAIESVLASTYSNFELIIVDDCSIDKTVDIIWQYAAKDPRVQFYQNEKNMGDYPNRNRAAQLAKGKYLMYVDSDDCSLPGGIASCVAAMEMHPLCMFGLHLETNEKLVKEIQPTEAIHTHFFENAFLYIGPGGTIINRQFFIDIGGYPEKYGPANDLYFNLKVGAATTILTLPFEFVFWRRHEGQEINNRYSYLSNNYIYLRDALAELNLPLNGEQKAWLAKKNKRRFVLNLIKFLAASRSIRKTMAVSAKANFSLRDALIGIFHI